MIEVIIDNFARLRLEHLVCDFNGTLAQDGRLIEGVASRVRELSQQIEIHVVTADTHGTATRELAPLPCTGKVIDALDQDAQKLAYVEALARNRVVAIGNRSQRPQHAGERRAWDRSHRGRSGRHPDIERCAPGGAGHQCRTRSAKASEAADCHAALLVGTSAVGPHR